MTQKPYWNDAPASGRQRELPDYLSVQQTAALLQMPRGCLVAVLKAGALAAERQGGRLVISAANYLSYQRDRDETQQHALDRLAVLDSTLL